MNKKQMVRLTESDLQNIIKESVMEILKENSENEIHVGSYLSSIFGQGRKKGEKVGRSVKDAAQRGWNSATDAVKGVYNNAAQGVKTMHQNAMQDSSIAGMKSSMNKFENDLKVFLENGGKVDGQLKSRLVGIMNMLDKYENHG